MNRVNMKRPTISLAASALFLVFPFLLHAADDATQVQLDAAKAGPRTVESLTERAIVRDYRSAWTSMARALEFNALDSLEGPFTGDAKQVLRETLASQQKSGLRQRYLDQNHKLEAVFYAPEGDVIELHDTAEYQQQILDGGKQIQDEHVVLHYVVLMTPSADRWVIRQMQAVSHF
ncbi:MAG: hypothetical protein WB566_09635 [Terriglobales bacterium]